MNMKQKITQKLQESFAPDELIVTNQSHLHAGHAGDDGSGESHFKIEISSCAFDGKSRVARDRMIYEVLSEEMSQIHALSIQILNV